jgi:cyclic beta-1,2-glucan synthetase
MLDRFNASAQKKSNQPLLGPDEQPIRGEVFSLERLQTFAAELATAHTISSKLERGKDLLARLDDSRRQLIAVYDSLGEATQSDRQLTPAGEWLIDNFHIVEEQLREVRQDLPHSYYKQLPKLSAGIFTGYPRIYHLAFEFVTHTDNRLDKHALVAFLNAYQRITPLAIGELWAFPISLRLSLIENLRRFAVSTSRALTDRKTADRLVESWSQVTDEIFAEELAAFSKTVGGPLFSARYTPALVVQLGKKLRDGNRFMSFALETIEQKLISEGETLEHLTHQEHNRQAAAQISVANIITSMRLLSTLDWRDFFESVSLVDLTLRRDPAQAYSEMDFRTRDLYRHQIEKIAKQAKASEFEVASRAIDLAEKNAHNERGEEGDRSKHVGFFLIDAEGLGELESAFRYKLTLRESGRRVLRRNPAFFYLFSITCLTVSFVVLFTLLSVWLTRASLSFSLAPLILSVLISIIPASELAAAITNRLTSLFLKPEPLPKMNFQDGIPETARTIVVIPTLLTEETAINDLCARLEVCYLANRDEQLYFALLGDLVDATSETKPEDKRLRSTAQTRVAELNQKYSGADQKERFFFFSRKRVWSAGEGKWICRERKRGNLHEFNGLLRGSRETSFVLPKRIDFRFLKSVRYVITLDADTQLPREAAQRLVGTIEHPLNRPYFDAGKRRVTKGYSILQPRIEIDLVSGLRTLFTRVFSDAKGFDPYTTAVSDVYQDLFGEGNYVGKGLYAVDAFSAALDSRIPENRLLSHDLFEGLFARVALATDIVLYDDYPSSYESFARRSHRWARGDWQIARWLLPFVPDANGKLVRNDLSVIARWKIFDNLRRSLLAPALVACLAAGWTISQLSPIAATLLVLSVVAAQLYLQIAFVPLSIGKPDLFADLRRQIFSLLSEVKINSEQILLRLTFLAHEAVVMGDAALRSLYRQIVSKRSLLQWVPAARADSQSKRELSHYLRFMAASPLIAITAFVLILFLSPLNLIIAAPFIVLWMLAPLIAFRLSQDLRKATQEELISAEEIHLLRLLARRTWRYFEAFVGQSDHWLPPDNFQEDPQPVLAHRTSPTNIGLLLLATVAARDLGYTGTLETIERIELTCSTLERLPRFQGHFFNWYDTHTLEPLNPHYISTVDSGNLAGYLIAVAQACREIASASLFEERSKFGLSDTLALLKLETEKLEREESVIDATELKTLRNEIEICRELLSEAVPLNDRSWKSLLDALAKSSIVISGSTGAIAQKRMERTDDLRFWAVAFENLVANFRRDLETLLPLETSSDISTRADEVRKNFATRLESIANFCRRLVDEMDFAFLYDNERKVLTIGYRPAEAVSDNSYYDLLASEARLASFIAIASGDIEQEHWFRLGRNLVSANGGRALVSWSGTMFEYLMPLLVMREFPRTLLAETSISVVRDQIKYGKQHNLPWGVSESAYNARDLELNYQYGPFGVPGLGLKRGLADDLVVAPYATLLAAQLVPVAAVENVRRLAAEGMLGTYGFYEAVDYTKDRLPPGQTHSKIEAYMTHHQGMILAAIDNLLHDFIMQKRFHADPIVESAELLLHERVPHQVGTIPHPRAAEVLSSPRTPSALVAPIPRRYDSGDQFSPRVCLLSNGSYTVMLTTAGSGFSRCNGLAVTRWREDAVCDNWGQFCYVRDVRSGAIWSAGFQPTLRQPQEYDITFTESKADIRRRDAGIFTHTEIIVSSEDNAELRRITLTNESTRAREIELTSFAEIVLNQQAADEAHVAFNNLFIETEVVDEKYAIIARRRSRSADEPEIWGAHTISVSGEIVGEVVAETDRGAFIGRGGTIHNPFAVANETIVENKPSLDSIFSLRVRLLIQPGESATVTLSTIMAGEREEVIQLAKKYRGPEAFERSMKLAWTRSQVELRYLSVTPDEANLYQRLAGQLIFADSVLRPRPETLRLNTGTQKDLWKYGISGDLPILLVRVSDSRDALRFVRQLVQAHEYLRTKSIIFDLVILNDQPVSYAQTFAEDLQSILRGSVTQAQVDKPGGIFLRRADIMPESDRIALHAVARACFVTDRGSLEEQLARQIKIGALPPQLIPRETPRSYKKVEKLAPNLVLPNGFGGFAPDLNEYVINLESAENLPPAPWSNVVANESDFGFLVTEAGMGVSWSQNSRENRLTPWSNDAVCDTPGECFYLRDEMTGSIWSPTALPIRENSPYTIRHGQGYSIFEHTGHGIEQELLVFAPISRSVKIARLRLKNVSERKRRLSATHFCELTLGVSRANSAPYVITEIDGQTGAIFARNPYNNEFAGRVAFAATDARSRTWTCDRREFLGRNGVLARPAAMLRTNLSGAIGAGLDPCSALQTIFDLESGETKDVIFLLGEEGSAEEARATVFRFSQPAIVESEFEGVRAFWDDLLNTIQVTTPDPATNLLMNRWLIYQSLACRFRARTSIYQSSGAFGFRDQLQDAMALIYSRPNLAREHILRSAAHQFKEGDVQHWWHEPTGRGTRTKSSDDLLWLPFVACFYQKVTGDTSVFDEIVPFIDAPLLAENQDEAYLEPVVSIETATLYEHCIRAVERSLKIGKHGLPLIGSGDWSDGMTSVGNLGEGESVWLGWFLATILEDFSKVCRKRGDLDLAKRYKSHARMLKKNLDAFAWDGNWYLRAFFDDGTPLGSHENDESRIDAIAQSWSVISRFGDESKGRRAMQAVEEYLIDKENQLSLLLTPPFDKSLLEPGYIKGYQPGVRENGGHYTHAAAWNVIAFAQLGEGTKAFELFEYLNPINHALGPDGVGVYKTEPYAVAADIYAGKYLGRGGWTWYTGAAGWMYRAMLESILGFKKQATHLFIEPCIPHSWGEFTMDYRCGSTLYQITVENPHSVSRGISAIEMDGKLLRTNYIDLLDDGKTYEVRIVLGGPASLEDSNEPTLSKADVGIKS